MKRLKKNIWLILLIVVYAVFVCIAIWGAVGVELHPTVTTYPSYSEQPVTVTNDYYWDIFIIGLTGVNIISLPLAFVTIVKWLKK